MESRGAQRSAVIDEAPAATGRTPSPAAGSAGQAEAAGTANRAARAAPPRERGERSVHRTVGCAHDGGPEYARTRTPAPAQVGAWQEGSWRFAAPATDASVPRLRHAVRDLLARQPTHVPDETLQGVLLILSELVTNAVRHAALLSPTIGVEIALGGGLLRVAVEDGHPYRPKALAAEPAGDHTGGRGLLLVKALTAEAGGVCDVEQTGAGGKVIWAALPLAAA